MLRQVNEVTDGVVRQVDAVDGFRELPRQPNLHTRFTSGRGRQARIAEELMPWFLV